MFIYYQTKYEYTCIYIAGNLFIAAIMRHYPRPEYQFQKSTCVVEQRFRRAGTLKMANKQHYILQDASKTLLQ